MKLSEFLSTLTQSNARVIIKDLVTNNEIADIKAGGYASLDDAIEEREVVQWQILTSTSILVLLKSEEE